MKETANAVEEAPYLPEGIIHHILSYLDKKERALARLVSKEWLKAWQSYPILEFDDGDIEKLEIYRGYVHKTLQRYQEGHIQKLSLDAQYNNSDCDKDFLNGILEIAENKGIIELQLNIHGGMSMMPVLAEAENNGIKEVQINIDGDMFMIHKPVLPEKIFWTKSLTDLRVYECKLINQASGEFQCKNILSLELISVEIDDETFCCLLLGCPLIKNLTIDHCKGLKTIKLMNISSLKELRICNMENKIEVDDGPSLESIYLEGVRHEHGVVELQGCKNLKALSMEKTYITDKFFNNFANKFPCLEILSVDYVYGLGKTNLTSHSLKEITFFPLKQQEIRIDAPNLCGIRSDFEGILNQLSFARECSSDIDYMVIRCRDEETLVLDDSSWIIKLNHLISNLRPSYVSIRIPKMKILYNHEYIKGIHAFVANPIPSIEELNFLGYMPPSLVACYSVFLDGLFWACRPKTIVVENLCRGKYRFMDILYEKLITQGKNQEFSDLPSTYSTKFSQHDLKNVEFIIYDKSGEEYSHKQSCMFFMNRNQPDGINYASSGCSPSEFVFNLDWNSIESSGSRIGFPED